MRTVYPRVCGGTLTSRMCGNADAGLFPRVRGNRVPKESTVEKPGSIPACAGEPLTLMKGPPITKVYLRVCGGTMTTRTLLKAYPGLSPRVRGNHQPRLDHRQIMGSIPACAGEPASPARTAWKPRVYPRVCGGTVAISAPNTHSPGLSPRVRGNPIDASITTHAGGSIPACAGEPTSAATSKLLPRSIPACAGEPLTPLLPATPSMVYPRVCGGTTSSTCSCLSRNSKEKTASSSRRS